MASNADRCIISMHIPQIDGDKGRDAAQVDDDAPREVKVKDALLLDLVLESSDCDEGNDRSGQDTKPCMP